MTGGAGLDFHYTTTIVMIHLQFIPTDVTDGSERIPDCSGKGPTLVQALADLETNLLALHGPEAAFEHTLFVGHADDFFETLNVVGGELHCHDFSSPEQAFRLVRQTDLDPAVETGSGEPTPVATIPEDFKFHATESSLADADVTVPGSLLTIAASRYGKPGSMVFGELYGGDEYLLCIDERSPDEREMLLTEGWPASFLDFLDDCHREGDNYIRIFA